MNNTRIQHVYFNVVENQLQDVAGSALAEDKYPYVIFQENIIINLHLVKDDANTPFDTNLDATLYYTASLDDDFNSAIPPMVRALNVSINQAGDWEGDSSGQADPTAGEFSIRIDAATTQCDDKLGNNEEVQESKLELLAYTTSGGPLRAAYRLPFRVLNIQDPGSGTPAPLETATSGLGTVNLVEGQDYIEVSGLGLSAAIVSVVVTVLKPSSGGDLIFGSARLDSLTDDGFIVDLSAEPGAGYKLAYVYSL